MITLAIALSCCFGVPAPSHAPGEGKASQLYVRHMQEEHTAEGIIKRQHQRNKRGDELKTYDYFFVVGKDQHFIRTLDNPKLRTQLEELVNAKVVLKYKTGKGLLDTHDPTIASRVGAYIEVIEIISVKR